MDNNASINQAMAMLMQMVGAMSSARMGAMAGGMGGGYSPYGIYGVHGMNSIYPEPQMFGGPFLGMLARMVFPSLTATGIDGNPAFLFRTTFTRPGDGTVPSYSSATARRNQAAARASNAAYEADQVRNWDRIFGEDSAMQAYLANVGAPPEVKALYAGMASNGPLGQFIRPMGQQFLNGILGYDRGVGLTNAQQRSSQLGAALMRGQTFNPYGDEFTGLRSGLASHVYGATDAVMYDGNVKKWNMYGASEKLVSDIIADAVASGNADRLIGNRVLGQGGMELVSALYGDEADKFNKDYSASTRLSVNNVTDLHRVAGVKLKQLEDENWRLQRSINEQKKKRENGEEFDSVRLEEDKRRMEENTKQVEAINSGLKKLGSNTSEGYRPLVEAVTEAVDTLKDLYGGEDEARRALSQITGGQGMKDQDVAQTAARQIRELKVYAGMAGLDPEVAGDILNEAMGSVLGRGGDLAADSLYQGQSAVRVTKEALKNVALAGDMDPQRSKEIIDATQARAASYANSETAKLSTLVMASEKDIGTEGTDAIMKLLESGSRDDFQRAKALFSDFTHMSDKRVETMMNDPTLLARFRREFTMDQAGRLNDLADKATKNNDRDILGRSRHGAVAEQARYNLGRAGISRQDVDDAQGAGEFEGLMSYLFTSDAGEEAGAAALQNTLDTVRKENPDWDERQVKAEAVRRFKKNMGDVVKDVKSAEKSMRDKGVAALVSEQLFTDGETSAVAEWLSDMGAWDEDGRISRAGLGAAGNDMLGFLDRQAGIGALRDSEGRTIDADKIYELKEKFREGIGKGTVEGGESAADAIQDFINDLDDSSKGIVAAWLEKNEGTRHYATPDEIREMVNGQTAMAKAMADENAAKAMSGMSEDDKQLYANLFNDIDGKDLDEKAVNKAAKELETFEQSGAEAQTDFEKVWQAVQDNPKDAWKVITNSNLTNEQKKAMMDALAGKFQGVVGDKVAETRSKAEGGEGGFTTSFMKGLLDANGVDATKEYFGDRAVSMDTLLSVNDDEAINLLSTLYGKTLGEGSEEVKEFLKAQKEARGGKTNALTKFLRDNVYGGKGDEGRRELLDAQFKKEQNAIDEEWENTKKRLEGEGYGEGSDEYKKAKEEYQKKVDNLFNRERSATEALDAFNKKGEEQLTDWDTLRPEEQQAKIRELREKGVFNRLDSSGMSGPVGSGSSSVSLSGPVDVNGFAELASVVKNIYSRIADGTSRPPKSIMGMSTERPDAAV